ncbi:MAG: hypothetical protein V7733_11290 [Paraglaciecola polaris]|tara:strand:- start:3574 stop:3723 length:150 start_codon:yes stop_codon:yes gene_type:complete
MNKDTDLKIKEQEYRDSLEALARKNAKKNKTDYIDELQKLEGNIPDNNE